jgi:hypothetical protein
MTDPNNTDDWADLYRELGVESGPASAKPAPVHHEPPPPRLADEPDEDTVPFGAIEEEPEGGFAESGEYEEVVAEDEGADGEPGEGEDEAEEAGVVGEGEPGESEPKKRRRRRRRRGKKKDAEPAAEGAAEAGGEDGDFAPEAAAEDGPAPESGRELIANWNVPSWEQIVAGLYRPDR